MQKFLHIWYTHLVISFIGLIFLFRLTKTFEILFNFSWYFWPLSTVISLLVSPSITLFCLFSCSLCVPYHDSAVPARFATANMVPLDKIYLSKITPRYLKTEYMWGAILAEIVLFVGTAVIFVVPHYYYFSSVALIYGDFHIKCLLYTQYGKNECSIFPSWTGQSQYLDQKN